MGPNRSHGKAVGRQRENAAGVPFRSTSAGGPSGRTSRRRVPRRPVEAGFGISRFRVSPLVCHIVVTLGCPSVAATRVRADSPAGPRRISYSSGRPWSDRHCEEIAVSSDEDAGRSQSLRSLRSLRHRTYGCRGVQLHGKTARTKCRNLNGVSWVPMSAA